ncbi:substrate-binding domain-containing protein [Ferrimonas aestuarii]|uniref:ABC transporter substrate-binding protein n=1 Tax=Ferrimonas aestuarii TaxID=2569539 RepID=A0A4U1BQ36_9GAMM|nr:substrate-binding domain-containing protein [Ferrimonas aestuarii]TKB56516.1 ABC transporter substrate-binding protein [Ferrimonas aestuarii]
MKFRNALLAALVAPVVFGCATTDKPEYAEAKDPKVVRVALIGGMSYAGLWPEVTSRFEAKTGYKVKTIKSSVRTKLAPLFREGKADLLTMHSGDITTDLVADGHGINMHPWTRNDIVVWGPKSDPANIRGLTDGAEAMRRIAESQSNWIDFRGIGPRELGHSLWKKAGIKPMGDWVLKDDLKKGPNLLSQVADKQAYIITGRMPVFVGKWKADPRMEILVDKDPTMRRPYIVMEANPIRHPGVNYEGAKALSEFLRSDEIQQFLLTFDGKVNDGTPLFYPVWPTLAVN